MPQHDPKGADRPSPADSPPLSSVPADRLQAAFAARSTCEERVRRVVALYVPDEVYLNAITSAVVSYAQQYAHAMARLYVDAKQPSETPEPGSKNRSD